MGRSELNWKLEGKISSWQLAAGSWQLEARSWKLEAGSWKLEAETPKQNEFWWALLESNQ
jgi:hypothetical protein